MAWNGIYAQYLIANKNDNDYNEYMKKSKIVRVVYIDAEAVWCIEKWNAVFQTWIHPFCKIHILKFNEMRMLEYLLM